MELLPLDGVRVVDWTIYQQGPSATCLLGNLGAEVIKIEELRGEPSRGIKMTTGSIPATLPYGRNYYFECLNFDKKSMTLDLKHPRGLEIVYRLVSKSDVFVQNFRGGVAERLHLDYRTLVKYNPKIIYASVSGYGCEGPDAAKPSLDYTIQARSGLMMAIGEEGMPPIYGSVGIADQIGGLMLSYSIILALLVRERFGIGQEVHVSGLHSVAYVQGINLSCKLLKGTEFPRFSRNKAGNPLWNHYKCGDGKWICFAMGQSDRFWHDFCEVVGIQYLENDPRFENMEARNKNCVELIAILDPIFASKPRQYWLDAFSKKEDLVCEVVNTISDLVTDPQVVANSMIENFQHPVLGNIKKIAMPISLTKTPAKTRLPAPELGQHTEEILTDICGYSWAEIEKLRDEGVF